AIDDTRVVTMHPPTVSLVRRPDHQPHVDSRRNHNSETRASAIAARLKPASVASTLGIRRPSLLIALVLHPPVEPLVHLGRADAVLLADHRHERLDGVLCAEELHHQALDDLLP